MPGNLSGPTLIVILFIVLLLFGAPKLPALARSLGQSMKILKKEVSSSETDTVNGADQSANTAGDVVADANASSVAVADSAAAELAKAKAEAEQAKQEAERLRQQMAASAEAAVKTTDGN